jgi:hypothetical protein
LISLFVCLFAAAWLFDGLSPWFGGEREREREFLGKIPFFSTFSFQQTFALILVVFWVIDYLEQNPFVPGSSVISSSR